MLKRFAIVIMAALMVVAAALEVTAQSPSTFVYQGRLTDTAGVPISSLSSTVVFSIYVDAGGTSLVWASSPMSVYPDKGGVFTVKLGPVGASVFNGTERYLGIKIGTDPEMTPRQVIASTPYSLNTNAVADGAITSTKIAANAVGSANIVDGSITTADLAAGAVTGAKIASATITAANVADEPGVNWYENGGGYALNTSQTASYITGVGITAPSAGYAIVTASGSISWNVGTTGPGMVRLKVSEVQNDVSELPGIQFIEMNSFSGTGWAAYPFSVTKVFTVASAGLHIYNLNAWHQVVNGTAYMDDFTLVVTFVPTRY